MTKIAKSSRDSSIAFRISGDDPNLLGDSQNRASDYHILPSILQTFFFPVGGILFLVATKVNELSIVENIIGFLLLSIPWWGYLAWKRDTSRKIPIFAFISLMYFVYYGLPLFWGDRVRPVWYANSAPLKEESITLAAIMALIGVISLWLGMRINLFSNRYSTKRQILGSLKKWQIDYIRVILFIGVAVSFWPQFPYLLGGGGRQLLLTFQTGIPLTAFIILFFSRSEYKNPLVDNFLIIAYLISLAVTALSSGWLGSLINIGLVLAILFLYTKRKLPYFLIPVALFYILFFQVGKSDYRAVFWSPTNAAQNSPLERLDFWIQSSFDGWSRALDDSTGMEVGQLLQGSIARLSLLTFTAHVIEMTPEVVPFQNGQLYSFLVISLIPRAIWAEKPIGNDANQFFQVAYDISREDFLENVSFASGYLTESYINFGWYGVVLIMVLVGAILNLIERVFLMQNSTILKTSLGIMMFLPFFSIESQLGLYLSVMLQQTVFVLLFLAPVFFLGRTSPQSVLTISSGL